ncbi:MAG: class I SAM-dependent methyltransferase [Nitrososphaerota archaeon]
MTITSAILSQLNYDIGYIIPPSLTSRWKLLIGNTKYNLPQVLSQVGELDMAFLDDDTEYRHRMFEYNMIWPHLRIGGCIISDNINLSSAFFDFLTYAKCRSLAIKYKLGLMMKSARSCHINLDY